MPDSIGLAVSPAPAGVVLARARRAEAAKQEILDELGALYQAMGAQGLHWD